MTPFSHSISRERAPSRVRSRQWLVLRAQIFVWRQGCIWVLCATAATAIAAIDWMHVRDARVEVAQLRTATAEARARAASAAVDRGRPDAKSSAWGRAAELDEVLRITSPAGDQLRDIVDLAKQHSIELTRGDYQTNVDAAAGVRRLQAGFAFRSSYPRARAFIEELLRAHANASIDQVVFQRDVVTQSEVQTTLRLSLWSAAPPEQALQPRRVAEWSKS